MKATEVRIEKALDPGESYVDPAFLLVETRFDDGGEPVTTIEYLATQTGQAKPRWQVVTLGQSVPLSHAAALEWAVSFAASRDIPVVYEREEARSPYAATPSASLQAAASSAPK
ncbi:MAG TPA: hypothetical protein VHH11_09175 [Gammaproteobacteria bacterium]|jgi:hypothetical protein|nr:hypothetical protein [Gammaproteobacteria bacterium]